MTSLVTDGRDPPADRRPALAVPGVPADRARVEEGIRARYREAGLDPPATVVWVRSPREAMRSLPPRRLARRVERLAGSRAGRRRRRARVRRPDVVRCALRSAAVAGGLVLEAGLVAVAAAAGSLPVLLVAMPAGLVLTVVYAPASLRDWVWERPAGPVEPAGPAGRRLRAAAHRATVTVLVLLAGAPVAGLALAGWHLRQVATGAAGTDRTGPLALAVLAATPTAALLGLVGGALAGLLRPGRAETAACVPADLRDRLLPGPGQPLRSPEPPGPGVFWLPTGRAARPSRAARRLDTAALPYRLLPMPGAAGGPWLWCPLPGVAVACEQPAELSVEADGSHPGERRLHCPDGPAVRWRDGTVEHWWRGTPVPRRLVEGRWGVRRTSRERNAEVRRAALERMGWPEFVRRAGLRPVSVAPDPGNPGRELRLYRLPRHVGRGRRLLMMVNGSPGRGGRDRVYVELVPATVPDAVAAAAWQYGVPAETYSTMQRRT